MAVAKYISPFSVGKRQTVTIDGNDPRVRGYKYNITASRLGAEIDFVGNNSLLAGLSYFNYLSTGGGTKPGDGVGGDGGTGGGAVSFFAPLKVENLVATKYNTKGITLTFDFDLTDPQNASFTSIAFQVYSPTEAKYLPSGTLDASFLDDTTIHQTITVTPAMMQYSGVSNFTNFTKIGVATYSGVLTNGWVEADLPLYISELIKPQITVSANTGSYDVNITNLADILAGGGIDVQIQSFTTDDTLSQVQAKDLAGTSVWVNAGPATKVSPVSFLALDGAHRWIRAFSEGQDGGKSEYSDYKDVSPSPVNPSNTEAPNIWASATAQWIGNDIRINWTNPSTKVGAIVKVKLVPYIGGVESPVLYALLTHTIATGETSWTIPQSQIYGQVGNYYSSYKVYISAVSLQGIESASTISYGPITRTSTLTTAPTATTQNTVDGYYLQFSLGTQGADFAQIYAYYINPSFATVHPPDYMDLTYSSGGASGSNTFIANSITLENGSYSMPSGKSVNDFIGMQITGNNVPNNTWITNISGSGPYTITLNNNFTGQASGNYRSQALVYTGQGPANVFSNYYGTIYVLVVLYDNYGNTSPTSIVYQVTPINPAQSVINNAVRIGAPDGAIWVGNNTSSKNTGARIVLGSSLDGNYSGIFAFDAGSIAGTAPTTSIISNDDNGHSYTFETKNAKIANWIVGTDRIQNTLGTSTNYVGMAASGTYSFWAGSETSGGDANANFSVTPTGSVIAKKITINGDGTGGNLIYAGGGNFTVSQTGVLNATGAKISGELNVTSSSNFNSNINMGSAGIFSAFGLDASGNPATQTTGSSVQIRGYVSGVTTGGVFAYDKSHTMTTAILATPAGNTGYTFNTYKALLGTSESEGWIVSNNILRSGNSKITLDAKGDTIGTNVPTIRILASDNNGYGITLAANGTTTNAISAGLLSSPDFYVKHDGSMFANNGTFTGTVKGSTIQGSNIYLTTDTGVKRIYMEAATPDTIFFKSNLTPDPGTSNIAGSISMYNVGTEWGYLTMQPPYQSNWTAPQLLLASNSSGGVVISSAYTNYFSATGNTTLVGGSASASSLKTSISVGQVGAILMSAQSGISNDKYPGLTVASFRHITAGTTSPSGGGIGDVYIQY